MRPRMPVCVHVCAYTLTRTLFAFITAIGLLGRSRIDIPSTVDSASPFVFILRLGGRGGKKNEKGPPVPLLCAHGSLVGGGGRHAGPVSGGRDGVSRSGREGLV
jgi:hypothetical protein